MDGKEYNGLRLISSQTGKVVELFTRLRDSHSNVVSLTFDDWRKENSGPETFVDVLYVDTQSEYDFLSELTKDKIQYQPWLCVLFESLDLHNDDLLLRCDDFVLWPCSTLELEQRLLRLLEKNHRIEINDDKDIDFKQFVDLQLVGQSEPFQKVLKFINQACLYDSPVIVEGETGTGKEMIARAIHYLGKKNKGPFIPINCGAIPDSLFENELYGHKRGAYTDASQDQVGLVEQADNGTLFLDEIETLSIKGQIVLLRFLQDMTYKPLGSKHHKTLNIRIVAASNQALENLVQSGHFRQDLYFRLNILSVTIPPLRERLDDVELLAHHFLRKYRVLYEQPHKTICMNTIRWLWRYHWPGNVRELENVIHRGFMLSKGDVIVVEEAKNSREFSSAEKETSSYFSIHDIHGTLAQAKKTLIEQFECTYLECLLKKTGGNVTKAALIAGKERRALGKLLKKHNIERRVFEK